MTFELTCTIDHKSFPETMVKHFRYSGDTIDDALGQIDTLPFHRDNLKRHRRTAFKDIHGAKHRWELTQVADETV